ncbi:hypothetical protein [uncultured Oxalicibacterium sp.]|uniref:hypothetical protein n=1 Tax=uncultured Oxalicibacterium sp. TaxID=1168540 RepID=UPI0025DB346C|nr:hypothetical protein [uncultured Oxalicibacterium sp.]
MKTKIQILYVKQNAGTSKKTGNAYDMRMAQTVAEVLNKDGTVEPLVGELMLPEAYKDAQPGFYLIDFRLSRTQQGRIESVPHTLEPCDSKGQPIAPPPQKQAA